MSDPTIPYTADIASLLAHAREPRAAAHDLARVRAMLSVYDTVTQHRGIDAAPADALSEIVRRWSPETPSPTDGEIPRTDLISRAAIARALVSTLEPRAALAHHLEHELEDLRLRQRAWLLEPGREALALAVAERDARARESAIASGNAGEQAARARAHARVAQDLLERALRLRGCPGEAPATAAFAQSIAGLAPTLPSPDGAALAWIQAAVAHLELLASTAEQEHVLAVDAADQAARALAELIG